MGNARKSVKRDSKRLISFYNSLDLDSPAANMSLINGAFDKHSLQVMYLIR